VVETERQGGAHSPAPLQARPRVLLAGRQTPGTPEAPSTADRRGNELLAKFDRALSRRVSSKREQTEAAFQEIFPRLRAHRAQGRTMKELLVAFNSVAQSSVCAKTFKAMFEAEASRRRDAGLFSHCSACGHPLPGSLRAEDHEAGSSHD